MGWGAEKRRPTLAGLHWEVSKVIDGDEQGLRESSSSGTLQSCAAAAPHYHCPPPVSHPHASHQASGTLSPAPPPDLSGRVLLHSHPKRLTQVYPASLVWGQELAGVGEGQCKRAQR
jgi:hypothetical protein